MDIITTRVSSSCSLSVYWCNRSSAPVFDSLPISSISFPIAAHVQSAERTQVIGGIKAQQILVRVANGGTATAFYCACWGKYSPPVLSRVDFPVPLKPINPIRSLELNIARLHLNNSFFTKFKSYIRKTGQHRVFSYINFLQSLIQGQILCPEIIYSRLAFLFDIQPFRRKNTTIIT